MGQIIQTGQKFSLLHICELLDAWTLANYAAGKTGRTEKHN